MSIDSRASLTRANDSKLSAVLSDCRRVWEHVTYIQSISQKPGKQFGTTVSATPETPPIEQVPAGQMQTATPWQFIKTMPSNGEKPSG